MLLRNSKISVNTFLMTLEVMLGCIKGCTELILVRLTFIKNYFDFEVIFL